MSDSKRPEDDTPTGPAAELTDETTESLRPADSGQVDTESRPLPREVGEVTQEIVSPSDSARNPESFPQTDGIRFDLGETIGEGGMATVREARDERLSRVVAVKQMKTELLKDRDLRRRFVREARILAELSHPGTTPVYDAGTLENGELFYAMERVEGRTFRDLLESRRESEIRDRSALLGVVHLFESVCRTMAYAHDKRIIHRDLKPSNIMVDRYGAVFVMDWGIAKRVAAADDPTDESQTRIGEVIGTPGYMSPEQAQGLAEAGDFQTDVFALGVILYSILTGIRPFGGRSQHELLKEILYHEPAEPRALNRSVARELSAVCMKALAKDPRRRYATAGELADDLRRLREFLPVSAIAPRLVDRLVNWVQRHRTVSAVLATLLLVGLATGAFFGVRAQFSRQMLDRGFELIEVNRLQVERLEVRIVGLQGKLDENLDGPARRELEFELDELMAQKTMAQLQLRSRLAAVIGFTLRSPSPRALELFRRQTLQIADNLLKDRDFAKAKVFAEATLAQFETTPWMGFAPDQVEHLREVAHTAESELRRMRAVGP